MNQYAEAIRNAVSARQALEAYGIPVNRDGYAVCPFHGEKTASLRVWDGSKGWFCFGCHAGGDVIDLVMRLFSISFPQALIRMDADFRLNLPLGKRRTRRDELLSMQEAKRREEAKTTLKWHNAILSWKWEYAMDDWLLWDDVAQATAAYNRPDRLCGPWQAAVRRREDARNRLDAYEDERRRALCRRQTSSNPPAGSLSRNGPTTSC